MEHQPYLPSLMPEGGPVERFLPNLSMRLILIKLEGPVSRPLALDPPSQGYHARELLEDGRIEGVQAYLAGICLVKDQAVRLHDPYIGAVPGLIRS